jgi:hypothetical protein
MFDNFTKINKDKQKKVHDYLIFQENRELIEEPESDFFYFD